uniref:alpha-L-fucosidase n=1 Tax=Prevotella sp. TaxID=59823 RepID=UPI003FEDE8D5
MKRKALSFALCLCVMCASAQTQHITFDDENENWDVVKGKAQVVASPSHQGKALLLTPGTLVNIPVELTQSSVYKVSAWLRAASGETSVTLQSNDFGNEFSLTSAKPDWIKVETTVNVPSGKHSPSVEVVFEGASQAWVDDIVIERLGDYQEKAVTGFLPKSKRTLVTDFGISQQSDAKMKWMHDAKIGMFIHWGLYAGPAQGEWYMENKGVKPENYRKLAYPVSGDLFFDAKDYDANKWMEVAKAMGAKYTVLTTMHHDGYALFDGTYMNAFTSKQTLNRDLVREYVEASRKAGMRVGLYKTLINWRHPGYYDINGSECKQNAFGYTTADWHKEDARLMKEELYCDTKNLMTNYGKIDMLFWDGGWIAQQGSDRQGAPFWEAYRYVSSDNAWPVNPYFLDKEESTGKYLGLIGMIRKYQPDILMNPRSGWIGDYTCDEGWGAVKGEIRKVLQEKCITLGPGWGYTKRMEDRKNMISLDGLKRFLADCLVRNMNLLINVGPDRHGHIPDAETELLTDFGKWVGSISDAVYETTAGPWQPVDDKYGFCYKDNKIYVYLLDSYKENALVLPPVNKGYKVKKAYVVDTQQKVKVSQKDHQITLQNLAPNLQGNVTVVALEMNKIL